MKPVEVRPNCDNASLEDVQVAMDAAPNKRSYIRLAAIRRLLRSIPRREVCEIFRHSDRMVRLWVHRYNQGGVDALISKPIAGRKRKVSLKIPGQGAGGCSRPANRRCRIWAGI